MFKRLFYTTIILVTLSLLKMQIASADFFSNLVDFSDEIHSYMQIADSYSYTFTLTDLNSGDFNLNLDSATLSLAHLDNSNSVAELWFSYSSGDILIGQLSTSTGSGHTFVVDSWLLSPAVLNEIESTDPWSLMVTLLENTKGTDKIKIDYSILAGNYSLLPDNSPSPPIAESLPDDPPSPPPTGPSQNSVPEPSTFFLVGVGLAGVGLLRKRFKK